jgi:hypothetical protein
MGDVGAASLLGVLVTLFGIATTLLIKAGDRSEERYRAEIDRLRIDKDATIATLENRLEDALHERDVWFQKAADCMAGRPYAHPEPPHPQQEQHHP